MANDIELYKTKKEITAKSYNAYQAVTSSPILANLIDKADSTAKRHLMELRNFGLFISESQDVEFRAAH